MTTAQRSPPYLLRSSVKRVDSDACNGSVAFKTEAFCVVAIVVMFAAVAFGALVLVSDIDQFAGLLQSGVASTLAGTVRRAGSADRRSR